MLSIELEDNVEEVVEVATLDHLCMDDVVLLIDTILR